MKTEERGYTHLRGRVAKAVEDGLAIAGPTSQTRNGG